MHLLGCMALIKSALPLRNVPNGPRGVLQLAYSLVSGTRLHLGNFSQLWWIDH